MLAIKKARKLIEANPGDAASQIIAALVLALETEAGISVPQLYALDDKRFELALDILNEWRLDRHYASKLRLLDSSTVVQSLHEMAPESATIQTP
jgi:tRNA A-37 threonylcarbamoyl transferase component Bud32